MEQLDHEENPTSFVMRGSFKYCYMIHVTDYPWCSFFIRDAPSYTPRSIAAATVKVPPMTAQTPVRNPANVFVRSSLLITFIGDMS